MAAEHEDLDVSVQQLLPQKLYEGRSTFLYVEDEEVGRWQQWRKVASGEAQAVISAAMYEDEAFAAGLHELDVPPLPEPGQITLAALGPFLAAHDDAVRRLVRAL